MEKSPHDLIKSTPYSSYREYLSKQGKLSLDKFRGTGRSRFVEELIKSGLRGRGGAGFSTGLKWKTLSEHPCPTRYLVCNAAEGEPGTFKDRFLLRKNPYAVLEGMAIAGEVIQAKGAYIGIKTSFAKELDLLEKAIGEMKAEGFFQNYPIHLISGPEEYLFGEQKALLNVIENEGPLPRVPEEPPYEVGLFATPESPNPALVNNVQSFAHVASIARHGAESFRRLGTVDTPGTILFTLSGDISRPGIYEVEAGISLARLLEEYGGGPKPGRSFKALLPGVSAAVLLPKQFDTPAEFGALKLAGSSLGSAGFIAIDDATSIPAVTRAVTRFLYVESCNQCSACKAGLRRASLGLDALNEHPFDEYRSEEILEAVASAPQGNRCYLPVQAAILVPSLLKNFGNEFISKSPADEWPIPKIVDYDEIHAIFSYDKTQRFKLPDWTFLKPGTES